MDHIPTPRYPAPLNVSKPFIWASAFLLTMQAASAATLTFGTASDYDDNFHEITNGGMAVWSAGGYVQKSTVGATTALYNTTATGGTAGSGGTGVAIAANDKFVDFTVQADFSVNALTSANSIGFYTKVNDAGSAGYVAIVRMTSATTADFRLWDSNSTLSNSGVGTLLSTQTFTTTGAFVANTFYTLKLDVKDVGGTVEFSASLSSVGGLQIGNTLTYTDMSSAATGLGQVGIRLGENMRLDNFAVTSIPEPGTVTLWVAGIVLTFAGIIRRRR